VTFAGSMFGARLSRAAQKLRFPSIGEELKGFDDKASRALDGGGPMKIAIVCSLIGYLCGSSDPCAFTRAGHPDIARYREAWCCAVKDQLDDISGDDRALFGKYCKK
jgi:hypothetical protein